MDIIAFPGIRHLLHWIVNNQAAIIQGAFNLIGALIIFPWAYLFRASPAADLRNYC